MKTTKSYWISLAAIRSNIPESRPKTTFAIIVINLVFILTGIAQTPEQTATPTPTPTCQGVGCAGLSRAELFIKTFASSGSSKGLRTSQLEQEEQVRLAFYGIDATRVEVEAGRLTESEGNFITEGHKQVIRNYVHDHSNDALIKASAGQVSDIPAISKSLGVLLTVARQDALMGHEESAQRAQAQMVKVLTTFSQQFANTCEQQSFPVETALALEKQTQIMGIDISLTHCMNRKFTAELNSQGVRYDFETCSDLSLSPKWKLKISGRVVGEGDGLNTLWEAKTVFRGFKAEPWGDMEISNEEIEEKEDTVKIPNDAGPNAKPNGWAAAPFPKPPWGPNKVRILKIRIRTILLIGERGFVGFNQGHWAETEIRRDDKPCNPVTQ